MSFDAARVMAHVTSSLFDGGQSGSSVKHLAKGQCLHVVYGSTAQNTSGQLHMYVYSATGKFVRKAAKRWRARPLRHSRNIRKSLNSIMILLRNN